MLQNFFVDVLMIRQSRYVSEDAINMYRLPVEVGLIDNWKEFLNLVVKPLDYVFVKSIGKTMEQELVKYVFKVEESLEKLDDFNRGLAQKYIALFGRTLHVLTNADKSAQKKWVNTGVYLGSREAWDFYMDKLAACLEYACHIRLFINVGCMKAIPTGDRFGRLLGDLSCVSEMMAR